jgi:hypothetical protein
MEAGYLKFIEIRKFGLITPVSISFNYFLDLKKITIKYPAH